MTKFPDEGELFKASNKKHEALIFFVHFYNGHKKALLRHIRFVNQLGYDAYAFNIQDKMKEHYMVPYSYISHKFGLKHAIADQIEQHLDLLTAYKEKIIFAFSNVSACAIEVMARRPDIVFKGLICDSGPTYDFVKSAYKLYTYAEPINFLPMKLIASPVFAAIWSKDLHKDVPEDLKKLPEGFHVLSIRGWKDKLIAPAGIDKIFEPCKNLVWQKLSLPQAEHLTGLRDFPHEYKPVVEDFLNRVTAS
jgi:hypothetical protein